MNFNKINEHLKELDIDYLYHLGLDTSMDLKSTFSDIDFVIFTSKSIYAKCLANHFININNEENHLHPLFKTDRFYIYKIRNFLIVASGIGAPTLSIALNEVAKLFYYVNNSNIIFIKIDFAKAVLNNLNGEIIQSKKVYNINKLDNCAMNNIFYNVECGNENTYESIINNQIIFNNIKFGDIIHSKVKNKVAKEILQNKEIILEDLTSLLFASFCNTLDIKSSILNIAYNDFNYYKNNYENNLELVCNLFKDFIK